MAQSKYKEMLMPADATFPANRVELLADLSLAFTYGLSAGVLNPRYAERLLKCLSIKDHQVWELIMKGAGRRDISLKEVAENQLADYRDMAKMVEESLPLD